MDIDRALQELREEREKIEEAILMEEARRPAVGGRRTPSWILELSSDRSDPPPTVPASQALSRESAK
jgi:hypothetical protein